MAESSGSHAAGGAARITFEYVRPGNRRSTFEGTLLHADHDLLVLSHQAHPSKPLAHAGRPVIEEGYDVVWFLSNGRPYDIGRFYRPDGEFTGYYVDILEPVRWEGEDASTLAPLIDLDLDLWIAPDGSYGVLDEDELEQSARRGDLSPTQVLQARSALDGLVAAVEDGSFPPPHVRQYVHNSQ